MNQQPYHYAFLVWLARGIYKLRLRLEALNDYVDHLAGKAYRQ